MEEVKQFLGGYIERSKPFFDDFKRETIKEAGGMGKLPKDTAVKFSEFLMEGKLIRGALMELGYKMSGGENAEEILKASRSIEVLHTGFLVQDDVMDRDETRRGLTTLHLQIAKESGDLTAESLHFGNSMAVNMGDAAFFMAIRLLTETKFSEKNKLRAVAELAERVLRVIYGQMLDVSNSGKSAITEEEVMVVHKYKTAEYTGVLPLSLGALLAGEEDSTRLEQYQEYGRAIGWAFQLQDDILGLFGDPKVLGKGVGSDLKEGRNTLFMIYLRKTGNTKAISFVESLLGREISEENLKKAQEIFRGEGMLDRVEKMRDDYLARAKETVAQMKVDTESKKILTALAEYLATREK